MTWLYWYVHDKDSPNGTDWGFGPYKVLGQYGRITLMRGVYCFRPLSPDRKRRRESFGAQHAIPYTPLGWRLL